MVLQVKGNGMSAGKKVIVNGVELELKDNIGGWCRWYIIKGELTNKEIVAKVRERFGGKTSLASIAWYRDDLANKGVLVRTKRSAATMSVEDFEAAE